MASPEMISKITQDLIRALEITMDPLATQASRQEAYTAYEHFKVNIFVNKRILKFLVILCQNLLKQLNLI